MNAENKHYWLKSGTFNLILNIQNLVFGFGGFYLLIRMTDKHVYGIWTLFIATTTIFETARNGLVQNALIKYLSASDRKEHPDIISASFVVSGLLMIACIALNVGLAHFLAHLWNFPELTNLFYMYSIVYLLQGILLQFQWIEQAYLSFQGVLLTSIIRQGGLFTYIFYCFAFHVDVKLTNLIYAQGLSALLGLIVEYFFIRPHMTLSRKIHWDWVKKLFNYGKFGFGTYFSTMLSGTLNQVMVGTFLSPEAAGTFNVALRITNLADIPANAVSVIVFPQSARRFEQEGNDAPKYLYEKSVGVILAMMVPCLLFFYVFLDYVVNIIAGKTYAETIPLIKITIITCLLNPFQRMFGIILDSIGQPRVNFIITALFTVANLGLTYFFLEWYGVMGAVYATLLADIIFFIIMQVILRRRLRINCFNTLIYAVKIYPELYETYVKPILKRRNPFIRENK